MKIDILTLFPEMFAPINSSILKRAQDKGLVEINVIDIRNFSKDKHHKCDDEPFGGGAGMVMTCQPLYDVIMSVKGENSKIIYLSPRGKVLNQNLVTQIACSYEHLVLICGHYEGIDERILEIFNVDEVSIGDYVLTGGELPAMVLCDAVCRYVPNVLSSGSTDFESFSNGLLEYPQYTRPQNFMGYSVPEVLLSGNHAEIEKFRQQKSLEVTKKNRPDLLGEKGEN